MRSNPRRLRFPLRPLRIGVVAPWAVLAAGLAFLPVGAPGQDYYYSEAPNGYGSFGGAIGPGTASPTDAAQAAVYQRRRDRAQSSREAREARQQQQQDEAADRRANAYQPPPKEDPGLSLFGYQPTSTEDIAGEMIAANQRRARSGAGSKSPIRKPPPGMTPIGVGDSLYYYKDGEFYVLNKNQQPFRVVAPLGATVFDLPADAQTFSSDGKTYFKYKNAYYTRALLMGQVIYEVVEPPANAPNG